MLTGSVIARKTSAKTSTLHIAAPIPAFMAVSMLELRGLNSMSFALSSCAIWLLISKQLSPSLYIVRFTALMGKFHSFG
jgi:hypothetical protein